MTLTMDSPCPHISQSKTRVLKSDMKTSNGNTFPELKNGPKTPKVRLFGLLFWVRRFGSFKRPPRRPKVAREGPKALPEGPWTPPGRPKREPKRLKSGPSEMTPALLTPKTPPEDVWETFGTPRAPFWSEFRHQNVLGNPLKK